MRVPMVRPGTSAVALAIVLWGFGAGSAAASDGPISVSVAVKAWMPSWQTWFEPEPTASTSAGTNDTMIAVSGDAEFIFIPALTLRHRNLFVSGSYFESPNFSFHPYTDRDATGAELTTNATAKRKETEVSLGYRFDPKISAVVGWKEVEQDFSVNVFQGATPFSSSQFSAKYTGPYVGAVLGTPIRGPVGAFSNFAFGLMQSDSGADASYVTAEVGLVYVAAQAVQVSLGYKMQTVNVDFGNPPASQSVQTATDVTQGITFGVHVHYP